ncbi:MAG: hypothetical protein Q4B64_01320 [Spirochaetales bacterium]|nr:hypothetical protein [Spirochaetales bacterium]
MEGILKLADDGRKLRQDKIDAMCEPERKAYEKRVADKPDMHLPYAEKMEGWKMYPVEPLNMLTKETEIELVSPDVVGKKIEWGKDFLFINPENGQIYNWVCNGHPCVMYTGLEVADGTLLRSKDPEYVEGKFRDSGR